MISFLTVARWVVKGLSCVLMAAIVLKMREYFGLENVVSRDDPSFNWAAVIVIVAGAIGGYLSLLIEVFFNGLSDSHV
ncbi:hypothetical protein FPOAC2_04260 [Fusarium poae]|uniref:hypothetical protein n=1 Tax=Fusarium poae TaxID=36050 RepID=UPI001CE7DB80|nr:hypothetical protein FPOAC1_004164 [Fusarium poae]KAG8670929.1 hypothetical protein FPOAC1_004164 [Fusarium poae]